MALLNLNNSNRILNTLINNSSVCLFLKNIDCYIHKTSIARLHQACKTTSCQSLPYSTKRNYSCSSTLKESVSRKFRVLNNSELKEFKANILEVINKDEKLFAIFKDILNSDTNKSFLKFRSDKPVSPQLEAKLKFKLGWIIINLRKLTSACDKKFLNDSSQFKFLTTTLLTHLSEKSLDFKCHDDIELEMELLEFSGINEYDVNKDAAAVSFNPERINQWNFFDSFKDSDEFNFSTITQDSFDKLNNYYQFNSILIDHGRSLNEKKNLAVDYTEDIVGSIENEIQIKIDELKTDFPQIENHMKELRMIIAKEWISKNEENIVGSKKNEENTKKLNTIDKTEDK